MTHPTGDGKQAKPTRHKSTVALPSTVRVRMPDQEAYDQLQRLIQTAPWGGVPELLGRLIAAGMEAEDQK